MTELARTRPESFFADRFNVTRSLLERVLGSNLIGRADDADIYLEYRVNEELQLEEGTVKKRSEEHTSELQSRLHLVCRLLLEKKKKKSRHAGSAETT